MKLSDLPGGDKSNYKVIYLANHPLVQCKECGAFVGDLIRHTAWHKNERLARIGAS